MTVTTVLPPLLIALHAVSATVAFGAGCGAARGPAWTTTVVRAMVAAAVLVAAAVAMDWSDATGPARLVFAGLLVLMAVLVAVSFRARRTGSVDDLGFVLISLFEGFVIVLLLDLGAPWWVVLVLALAGVAGGHLLVRRARPSYAAGLV